MMGRRKTRAAKLFYTGINLDERVPTGHRLRRIAEAVSFERVRPTVAGCYGRNGHASVDPVVLLKLMLLLFIEDVPSERELMRQLPLRLDWLWFLEMDLDDSPPDHSVLSKARRLWGLAVFESLFTDVLRQCVRRGLVDGDTLHADATVLQADAGVESRVARRLWEQLETGLDQDDIDNNNNNNDDDDDNNNDNNGGGHDSDAPLDDSRGDDARGTSLRVKAQGHAPRNPRRPRPRRGQRPPRPRLSDVPPPAPHLAHPLLHHNPQPVV